MASKDSYLELILGPMFSGKTSKLIEIYKQCVFCNMKILVINHSSDKRYNEIMLSSHDNIMIQCIQLQELKDINKLENYNDAKIILINEGQFFIDLYESVLMMLNNNKKIYIAGLDGDFERKKFGTILDLVPHCDKITKLTSLCAICKDGKKAIFSKRLTQQKEQTVIGIDNYIPVCRECYDK